MRGVCVRYDTHMSKPEALKIDRVDLDRLGKFADLMVQELPPSMVISLVGTLGAGKTTLVQAIARSAEIDAAEVTSPTFTLLQTHQGRFVLHHLDAYRLADEDEFLELGVDELFDQEQAWTLVEWGDRVASVLPRETLWIHLDLGTTDDTRAIQMKSMSADIRDCCQRIVDRL